jgi:hypothetical protein
MTEDATEGSKIDADKLMIVAIVVGCVVCTSSALAYVSLGCSGVPLLRCAPTAIASLVLFACAGTAAAGLGDSCGSWIRRLGRDKSDAIDSVAAAARCARIAGAAFAMVSLGDALLETDYWKAGALSACSGHLAILSAAASVRSPDVPNWRKAVAASSVIAGELIALCIASMVAANVRFVSSIPTVSYLVAVGAGGTGAALWGDSDAAMASIVGVHAFQLADAIAIVKFPGRPYLVAAAYWIGCVLLATAPALSIYRSARSRIKKTRRAIQ